MLTGFDLPAGAEAHEPPELRGHGRDDVRLMVSRSGTGAVSHHGFRGLPELLDPGDVLVVNTSATLPAAVPAVEPAGLVAHFSTELPDGAWLVEVRRAEGDSTVRHHGREPRLRLPGGALLDLEPAPSDGERLRRARLDRPVLPYLRAHGRPIAYGYVHGPRHIGEYQTVFAAHPGSAEMPSAARPFTAELVLRLAVRGVLITPITLHTGVASAEYDEAPYPERYRVPAATADLVTQARAAGRRVVAVGTTVVRTLESAVADDGTVRAATGWTDLVLAPPARPRAVTGLLTGLHEPRASHLLMLSTFAGEDLLARCYVEALDRGYRWHEFGDLHLLLP
ncbi:MAG: S-adenosylmethionine:tRNA ribosyltransferase-isomerase [Streptosporangiales bacterium]|nr:S-adenosylmethionine:tRNA ribosyltransferase-isomerase [Streptosporangiales bacterium]